MSIIGISRMSQSCTACGSGPLERTRRNWFERVTAERVLACTACHTRVRIWRPLPFAATFRFLTSSRSLCICCGTTRVRRLPARDDLDRMSHHPLSLLFRLTLAPIYYCNMCRLQYHDWRPAALAPVRANVQPIRPRTAEQLQTAEAHHSEAISA
jgi:hypothetical protein